MNNRVAFIDFVRGLLNINPLERWSPQQAKLHPFITQQKYTGPFVPPMNLKSSSVNRSPAPGTQQQQQAEALSKQRAAAAAQAASAQAHTVAQQQYASGVPLGQYPQAAQPQAPPMYNNMYSPSANHQGAPPPYPSQQPGPYNQMGMMPQAATQMPAAQYEDPNSRTCTSKPTYEPGAKEPQPWKCSKEAYPSQSRELPATSTPANLFASSPALHTTPHPPTDSLTETRAVHGGEEAEQRKADKAAHATTATSSATWRIAHSRRVSWDRANGIDCLSLYHHPACFSWHDRSRLCVGVLSTFSPGYHSTTLYKTEQVLSKLITCTCETIASVRGIETHGACMIPIAVGSEVEGNCRECKGR